jgi:CRP-like cAMP-binding protein
VQRGNFFWQIISNPGSETPITLTSFMAVAGNIPQLIDLVDQTLLYGRMQQSMRQSLANAIAAQSDNTSRVQVALYLTTLSGYYAVQY